MTVSNGKKNNLASYQMRVERARTILPAVSCQTHNVQLFQESFKHIVHSFSWLKCGTHILFFCLG